MPSYKKRKVVKVVMKSDKKIDEFHIGTGKHLVVKSSTTVEMRDNLTLMLSETEGIGLEVEIKADFDNIPKEYHQIFLEMMSVRYGGIINIWDNTKPFTNPIVKKRKWYQFWKS